MWDVWIWRQWFLRNVLRSLPSEALSYPRRTEFSVEIMLPCKGPKQEIFFKFQPALKGKKLKGTLVQALRLCKGRTVHSGSRGIALPFHDHVTRRGWEVIVKPRPLLPRGKTRYPLYMRMGGPQVRSGQVQKISLAPGFDSRTVQPVASRYTDYATRPTALKGIFWKFSSICRVSKIKC